MQKRYLFIILMLITILSINCFASDLNRLKENLRNYPDSYSANFEIGSFYEKQGNFIDAIKFLKKAIQIDNKKPMAYTILGSCYDSLGEYDKSVEIYKKCLEIDPKNDLVCSMLAMSLTELGDFKGAVQYFKKAIKLNNKNEKDSVVQFGLGNAYVNLRNYKKAVKHLKNAVELNPNLKNGILLLGLSYNETGEWEKAFDQYVKLQKLDKELALILLQYLSRS